MIDNPQTTKRLELCPISSCLMLGYCVDQKACESRVDKVTDAEIVPLGLARIVRQWIDVVLVPPDVVAHLQQAEEVIREREIGERAAAMGVADDKLIHRRPEESHE